MKYPKTELFINGKWINTTQTMEVINPSTGNKITDVSIAQRKDTELAVRAASESFKGWSSTTVNERRELLLKIANEIRTNKDHLVDIMNLEMGKPKAQCEGEVEESIANFEFYAHEILREQGRIISDDNLEFMSIYEPIGVVLLITPWNFPLNMLTRKLAPALAAGNTALIKPSSQTPLTALKLMEILEKSGLSHGEVNLLLGKSSEIMNVVMPDSRIGKISFTGSTAVGKKLYQQSSDTIKNISLELGGNAPYIITKNANIKKAAEVLVAFRLSNSGQVCISPNRVLVHEDIIDEFTEVLISEAKCYRLDKKEQSYGPLIEQQAYDKVDSLLKNAVQEGANIIYQDDSKLEGFEFPLTIINNVQRDMEIYQEEIFGPIISMVTYNDQDDILEIANETPYGLAGYIFTDNQAEQKALSRGLKFGMVGINTRNVSEAYTPFGGVKSSGIGVENGIEGLNGYRNIKLIARQN